MPKAGHKMKQRRFKVVSPPPPTRNGITCIWKAEHTGDIFEQDGGICLHLLSRDKGKTQVFFCPGLWNQSACKLPGSNGAQAFFLQVLVAPEGEVGERVGLTSTPYGRCLVIYMSEPELCHTYEPMSAKRQTQPHGLFYKLNETGPILGLHTTNSIKGSVEANETTS